MDDVNLVAVAVASVSVWIVSTRYYVGFTKQMAALHPAYAEAAGARHPVEVGFACPSSPLIGILGTFVCGTRRD
jgi:ABC-type uncharacterized transport system permease subunit